MALRKRTDQEETKLRGADRARDSTKFKLGQFRTLENWIPAHVYSIKKKRGVELLDSTPNTPVPPLPCEGSVCTDASLRGQQDVSIEERFFLSTTFPGPQRVSWGFITDTEEVYALVGQATCAGGNMAYDDTCCQLDHYQTPSILDNPALIDPDPFLPFVNTTIGTSDVPIYGCRSTDSQFKNYYPLTVSSATYQLPAGYQATTAGGENMFCKNGTSIYFTCHFTAPPFDNAIVEYDAVSGVLLNTFLTLPQFARQEIAATTNFLYVLGNDIADPTQVSIKKLDRTDGSVVGTLMLDNIGTIIIAVVNDDLIYVLTAGAPAALYYVENFTSLKFIGYTEAQSIAGLGNVAGVFAGGALYYGGNGFGFSGNIFKVTIACPDANPIVATVDRGAASVAAGATITASWADVLEPDALDRIQLHSAPVGSDLGFTAASLINSQVTDGLGTSSIVYTIPGGTPAGTYVFMYAALNSIYVATSPTFTVT